MQPALFVQVALTEGKVRRLLRLITFDYSLVEFGVAPSRARLGCPLISPA
jgi:hypothetical protein